MAPCTNDPRPTRLIRVAAAILSLWPACAMAEDVHPTHGNPPAPGEAGSIASGRVMVGYKTKPTSPQPTTAELWYTRDRGQSWQKCPEGPSRLNPIPFDAPEDGLYGFYLILHGEGGASAQPPKPGFAPQSWVRVDRCAPVVQLLQLAPDERFDLNRQVLIRWNVQDDNLPDRPTALHYRTESGKSYGLVADTLSASSSYVWTVPEGVRGRVEIKVSAVDRAGHTGRYVADRLHVDGSTATTSRQVETLAEGAASAAPAPSEPQPGMPLGPTASANLAGGRAVPRTEPSVKPKVHTEAPRTHQEPDAGPETLPQGAAGEAQKKYDLGTWHRLRGDYAVAAARFREALSLNPGHLAAKNDLAGVLYLQGDHAGAEGELRELLAKAPRHRPALKTLALVQVTQGNYRSSAATLETLLLLDEADAEAWLYLGDVRLFMGERASARDAWTKAATIEKSSPETKERAQKRLNLYSGDRLAGGTAEQP